MRKIIFLEGFMAIILVLSGCSLSQPSVEKSTNSGSIEDTVQKIKQVGDEAIENNLPTKTPPTYKKVTDANDIIGSWNVIEGTDYEEITLDPSGIFFTFLHDKPFYDGTWYFNNGVINFKSETYGNREYRTVILEENKIYIENEIGDREVWEPKEPVLEGK